MDDLSRRAFQVPQGPKPSNLTKDEIEQIAESVAEGMRYTPSSDLSDLLPEIGGKVSVKDFWKLDGTTDESIVVQPDASFEIFVPPHTSPERDRFTIAHELGHYVLHFLPASDARRAAVTFSASRYGSQRVEWEANRFAAGFLMPRGDFEKTHRRYHGHIGRIAQHFNVSTAAAYVRAKALGLDTDGNH